MSLSEAVLYQGVIIVMYICDIMHADAGAQTICKDGSQDPMESAHVR